MKISTRSITLAATLAALCAVTGLAPYVFFLPVVVAASTLSLGLSAFVGLAFGCISLAYSYVMPMSIVSVAFTEAPYIAIIPRVLAAIGCFGVYRLIQKLFKPQKRGASFAAVSVSAAVGSILNTALVVTMFVLIKPDTQFGGITMMIYVPTMLISGAIECACMAILAPPIALTLKKTVLKQHDAVKPTSEPTDGVEAQADGSTAEPAPDRQENTNKGSI